MNASAQLGFSLWVVALASEFAQAQPQFTELDVGLPGAITSSVAWGDYDNDGHLDIAIIGAETPRSRIYRNNGDGTFTDIAAGLEEAAFGAVMWGDYDNDGELDIAFNGLGTNGNVLSRIYRNEGGRKFTDIGAGLAGVASGGLTWGDYDSDGRLDLLLTGYDSSGKPLTRLFRNERNGTFTDVIVMLPGVEDSSVAWGDYDNDGRLDVILAGHTLDSSAIYISRIYRSNGNGTFTDIQAGLPGVVAGAVAWGDYNNDGQLDFLMTGLGLPNLNPIYARVYRNNGGTFSDVGAGLTGVEGSSVAWGDYDNDGRLDIALTGITDLTETNLISKIYHNNGDGTFTDIGAGLPGVRNGAIAWGDYDNDGDLDLLLTGQTASGQLITRIYRNESVVKNTPPTAPSGLSASVSGQQVTLNWLAASDAQTPALGLTYNIRVGTRPGGVDIVSPQSASDGFRRVPQMGNAQHRLFSRVVNLQGGIYYWSVQAVDTAFAGGPFAPEQTFVVPPAIQGIELPTNGAVLLSFLGAPGGTNYVLEASTNLTVWSGIANLSADSNGTFEYTETNVASVPVRFFRLRSQ